MRKPKFIKKLAVKKPELLFVGGIACIAVGTVTACIAAFKERDVIYDMQEDLDEIHANENLTKEEKNKKIFHVYVRTGVATVKHFALPVIFEGLGIAMITKSHTMMKTDMAALGAELTKKTQDFSQYRKNVVDDAGKEKDMEYLGIKKREWEESEVDADGSEVITHKTGNFIEGDLSGYSIHAKFFDEASRKFCDNPEDNICFLQRMQDICTQKLRAEGYLFLNDVYDILDIPRTVIGQQVGWILGKGPDYVDFGLYEIYRDGHYNSAKADFINGYEKAILLDFNVYGYIIDEFTKVRKI